MTDDMRRAITDDMVEIALTEFYSEFKFSHEKEFNPLSKKAMRHAITAALRAAPEAVALRTAMRTLEQIANAPDDHGARFKAAGAVAFLITQGAGGPEGFVMVPVELTLGMLEAGEQELAMGNDFADAREAAIETMLVARPQGVK